MHCFTFTFYFSQSKISHTNQQHSFFVSLETVKSYTCRASKNVIHWSSIIIMAPTLWGQIVFFSVLKYYPQTTLTRTLDAARCKS